jgi:hypothetical protein
MTGDKTMNVDLPLKPLQFLIRKIAYNTRDKVTFRTLCNEAKALVNN